MLCVWGGGLEGLGRTDSHRVVYRYTASNEPIPYNNLARVLVRLALN